MGEIAVPDAGWRSSAQLAAQTRPLRELMFQLWLGRTRRSWVVASRRHLATFFEDSYWMSLEGVFELLHHLDQVLKSVVGVGRLYVDEGIAAEICATYADLSQRLPDHFPAESDLDARRVALFEAVLLRAPGVSRDTLSMLRSAGFDSFSRLRQASTPEALCMHTHIDLELATRLLTRLRDFDRERETRDLADLQAQGERRLRAVAARLFALGGQNGTAAQPNAPREYHATREGLESIVLELEQVLAELGELELAAELRGVPIMGKVERIQRHLSRGFTRQ